MPEKSQQRKITKENFRDSSNTTTYRLWSGEIRSAAEYYRKKYGLIIYINGDTDYGRERISEKQTEIENQLQKYRKNSSHAHYIIDHLIKPGMNSDTSSVFAISEFSTSFKKHYQDIINFLYDFGYISSKNNINELHECTELQIANLQDDFMNYLNNTKNLELKNILDTKILKYRMQLQKNIYNALPTKEESIHEIRLIQAALGSDESVAYIYKGGQDSQHCETIIIEKDKLIKPIHWDTITDQNRVLSSNDIPELFYPRLGDFISNANLESSSPQVEAFGCVTFNLIYIKELLKKNAIQLNNALKFNYLDKDNNKCYFFVPPAEVLRYTQYSLYNKILAAMLQNTIEPVEVKYKDKTYYVKTIKKMLEDNLIVYCNKSNTEISSFSHDWLQENQISEEKRNNFKIENRYLFLSYKSRFLGQISNQDWIQVLQNNAETLHSFLPAMPSLEPLSIKLDESLKFAARSMNPEKYYSIGLDLIIYYKGLQTHWARSNKNLNPVAFAEYLNKAVAPDDYLEARLIGYLIKTWPDKIKKYFDALAEHLDAISILQPLNTPNSDLHNAPLI